MEHQCTNASSVIACTHVIEGRAADVILCNDDGSVDVAACFACADEIDAGNQAAEALCSGYCGSCFAENTNLAGMAGPGFWVRQNDGTYKAQAPA